MNNTSLEIIIIIVSVTSICNSFFRKLGLVLKEDWGDNKMKIKVVLILVCFYSSISMNPSESELEYSLNKAIELVVKDSILLEYSKDCSREEINSFHIEQDYTFSFFKSYLSHKTEFDSLLGEYIDSNINPFLNQKKLWAKDSLRYLKDKMNVIKIDKLKCYDDESPNFLFLDVVDNHILQLNIETRKCPYKGIEFIFLMDSDSLIFFSKSSYNY